ncbi:ABC transporter substrate-binding protein [Deinococcus yavapaiensis]|uniref:Substrate-binding family protein n=1 Tax=Deinococcus yavapaiensis KR-236 TaxID=694435 RepID=A0A318SIG1_9DEIO|nr:ABC transporter substrate-binding protein [Deinococcus yavapaiensis]PYE53847.1 substrate-binding family protein [Deinococcus yavapaiensis KR-236]
MVSLLAARRLPLILTLSLAATSVGVAAPLRFGVITSITGRGASVGAQQLAGFAAGVAEIKRRKLFGDRQVTLIVQDDASSVPQAVLAANSLAARNVRLIFSFDAIHGAKPLASFATKQRLPLVFLEGRGSFGASPFVVRLSGVKLGAKTAAPVFRKQLGKNATSAAAVRAYLGLLAAATALHDRDAERRDALPQALTDVAMPSSYGTVRFTSNSAALASTGARPR